MHKEWTVVDVLPSLLIDGSWVNVQVELGNKINIIIVRLLEDCGPLMFASKKNWRFPVIPLTWQDGSDRRCRDNFKVKEASNVKAAQRIRSPAEQHQLNFGSSINILRERKSIVLLCIWAHSPRSRGSKTAAGWGNSWLPVGENWGQCRNQQFRSLRRQEES